MTANKSFLKKYFGYDTFRPLQEEVIDTLMQNKDALLLMPTGGGKSICFQLPAIMKEGTALVISPLIALMKDQVGALKANGIEAAFLNSSLSSLEADKVREDSRTGKLKLLYMAPETIVRVKDSLLNEIHVSMIAIDEAHCISSWGHDFRPEYLQLSFLKEKFPDVPVIALTATADKVTRKDILRQMGLNDSHVFISSFDRPNLSLEVKAGVPSSIKISEIEDLILKYRNDSGIVYCLSRKSTEIVAEKLKLRGINCAFYHAGMESSERSRVQEAFIKDDIKVIVATIAFGMGIDKSNVRFVVHYNLPKNIESYYQEIGRAGRDGLPSETVLYFSFGDMMMLRQFAEGSGKKELALSKLKQMQDFAESGICRRKTLLNYFSETMTDNCNNCDVCKNPPKYYDGTVQAQMALSAMMRTEEKTGFNMIINILRGSRNQEILDKGFDAIKTYGAGREFSYEHWQSVMMQMLQLGLIELAYDEEYALKVTPFGKIVLQGKSKIHFAQHLERERRAPRAKRSRAGLYAEATDSGENVSEEMRLFEELRVLRKLIADSEGLPPYVVFNDNTLKGMARGLPETASEMLDIVGVSRNKMDKYGREFMNVVKKYATTTGKRKPVNVEEVLNTENLEKYISEMRTGGSRLSHHVLALVLAGTESKKVSPAERELSFYGLLEGVAGMVDIRPRLKKYFDENIYADVKKKVEEFFAVPTYNHLADAARSDIAGVIANIPIEKPTETLTSQTIVALRKSHPRSHEPWSQEEIIAFGAAIEHTNDVAFLSDLFQRSPGSIRGGIENTLKRQMEEEGTIHS